MAGMLQIITYLLAVYLVFKGVEILQIGLASSRPDRTGMIIVGVIALIICTSVAGFLVNAQDEQAQSLSRGPGQ
jgi:hypothetical protein